ncbi:MAG TPA: DUF5916 domain-containing protein [Gemmatimonadales bacterium]|nr:DUF5916 domain-containing protein [Gemmatimonadales bacterium]
MANAALLFLAASLASAQAPQSPTPSTVALRTPPRTASAPPGDAVMASRTSVGITLDGALDEPAWQSAAPISSFTQKDPNEGQPATQRTEVRVLYDEGAVYFGAELFDTAPDSIVAQLARRDNHITADVFWVFLDPYLDRRTGFYFGVNAAGTLYDGTLYNDSWDDNTWDGIWDAQVRRTERGWTVEMRIPYSQLRFQERPDHVWGINFRRDIPRNSESSWLVFTPKNGSGFVSRFPELRGISGVKPPRRLEVLPYVTGKASFLDHAAGDPFNDGSRYTPSAGVDLKLGLGSNLTVDATVNPDFGQVEVDPAVVNLSDVESFFDEKRPFFIEGANIFNFGSGGANNFWGFNNPTPDFLYTRRIGRAPQLGASAPAGGYVDSPEGTHILGAAKLSGKLGDWSLGTLSAFTKRESATIDDGAGGLSRSEVEPFTYYGAARMQRDIAGGRQGIGFLSTATIRSLSDASRDQLNSGAYALAMDGWTFLDAERMWALTAWFGASHVRGSEAQIERLQRNSIHYFQRPDAGHVEVDPSATSLSGLGGRVTLNKQRGEFYSNTAIAFLTPGFEVNDLGFQWTSDIVNAHQVIGYRLRTPTNWYRQITVNTSYVNSWDFDGNRVHQMLWMNSNIQFPNYYWAFLGGNYLPDRLNNRRTRGGPLTVNPAGFSLFGGFDSDGRKSVVFGVDASLGRFSQGSERSWSLGSYVEWKPMDRLSLRVSPEINRLRTGAQFIGTIDDPAAAATFGREYIFAPLNQTTVSSSVRMNWIFTPKLSLELYAQPLISSVEYGDLHALEAPRTYSFLPTDGIGPDPDGAGPDEPARVTANDFTFASLRGNAVVRWEYLPGSTLFLVWTQSRSASEDIGSFRLGESFDQLIGAKADNIFLVKLTYWWNP